jgi:Zn-dependent peptidase ImmA (M78 family)
MAYVGTRLHWTNLRGASPGQVREAFHQYRPAYDPYVIVESLGVQLNEIENVNWSGAVRFDGVNAAMWLKKSDGRRRKRFTLAHELGHLLLHSDKGDGMFRDSTFGGTPEEQEANAFAAELLMPADDLRRYGAGFGSDSERLADIFDVSTSALNVRLSILRGVRP